MYKTQMSILLRIIVFPFTSLECYQEDFIKQLSESKDYKAYWERYNKRFKIILYRNINQKYNLDSLDFIDLTIQKYYGYSFIKGKMSEDIYLNILSKFAKSFICHRNGRIALKYWESGEDASFIGPYKGINKIALWNALNRMMCTDLIVVQYLLNNKMEEVDYLRGYYSSIMLEDIQLEKVLMKGVAETHIHKGAAINFMLAWIHLMNLSKVTDKEYEDINLSNPLYQGEKIQLIVGAIAVIRLLLVHFLAYSKQDFNTYMNKQYQNNEEVVTIVQAVSEGRILNDSDIIFYDLKKVWEYLKAKMNILFESGEEDYIGLFLEKPEVVKTTGENIFLFRAMKYIKKKREEKSVDLFFSRLFFQYVKIKNRVFEAKVQENSIKGLKYFQPFYNRSTELDGYSAVNYWLTLMHAQLQNKHLKKLEFRFGFDGTKRHLKKILISFFKAYGQILK